MAKERPIYEENTEFTKLAIQIVEKYPEHFYGIKMDQVCCVNIVNKDRPTTKKQAWRIDAVKMPMALHCAYGWYVVLFAKDWDEFGETQKLLLVSEILHSLPSDESDEGKVVPMDTKGYAAMYRTFNGIDYLDDPDAPNILEKDVVWK